MIQQLDVYQGTQLTTLLPKSQITRPRYWRVNHDKTPLWRVNLPEVFRLQPFHSIKLTELLQWLWRRMNPQLTDEQWTQCLGNELAFTNHTGFPGRNNYITGDTNHSEDPRLDFARVCGGAILKEKYVSDGKLYFEAIDTREPLPTHYDVMSKPWLFFEAVNIAEVNYSPVIRPLKGRWRLPVYVPLLISTDAYYPIDMLTKLPENISILPSCFQYP